MLALVDYNCVVKYPIFKKDGYQLCYSEDLDITYNDIDNFIHLSGIYEKVNRNISMTKIIIDYSLQLVKNNKTYKDIIKNVIKICLLINKYKKINSEPYVSYRDKKIIIYPGDIDLYRALIIFFHNTTTEVSYE